MKMSEESEKHGGVASKSWRQQAKATKRSVNKENGIENNIEKRNQWRRIRRNIIVIAKSGGGSESEISINSVAAKGDNGGISESESMAATWQQA